MGKKITHTIMQYMVGNFTCREIAELMTEYLEGSLTFRERIRFHMHVGLCFACRNYLRQMKYTIATLRQLPPDPIPAHVKEELLARFRHWKHRFPPSSGNQEKL